MLFKLADSNNNGQISEKEAVDAGNLLVGGFFFRADANGDGVLTPDEALQARDNLFAQQPSQPVAGNTNDPAQTTRNLVNDPVRTLGTMLDTNRDQKIAAGELRQAVQSGVQTLFSVADTNEDGQLSPYELNGVVGEVAKSAVQNAFQAADLDRNGQISMDEYDKALIEPAHALFRVIDANNDNQISFAELERAEQILVDQLQRLRVAEPNNSLSSELQGRAAGAAARRAPQPIQPAPAPGTQAAPVSPGPR
jgi:Ca2+-binding EF-hand superfamily protein